MDESGQSGSLHEIAILRFGIGNGAESWTWAKSSPNWQMCFIECPECWSTINELGESWDVKIDLIEESYEQEIELRGDDADMPITSSSKCTISNESLGSVATLTTF